MNLFIRVKSGGIKDFSHSCSFLNLFWNSVNQTEFGWQKTDFLGNFYLQKRLLDLSEFDFVGLEVELFQGHHLTFDVNVLSERVGLEVHFVDHVAALVAPVGDDGSAREVLVHLLLRERQTHVLVDFLLDHVRDLVQHRLRRHELVDVVDDQRAPRLVVERRGAEARPVLQLHARHVLCLRDVEESRTLSNLFELSIPESLLNDDVEQVVNDVVFFHLEHESLLELLHVHHFLGGFVNEHFHLLATEVVLDDQGVFHLLREVDVATRANERPIANFDFLFKISGDLLDPVGVPDNHGNNAEVVNVELEVLVELHGELVGHQLHLPLAVLGAVQALVEVRHQLIFGTPQAQVGLKMCATLAAEIAPRLGVVTLFLIEIVPFALRVEIAFLERVLRVRGILSLRVTILVGTVLRSLRSAAEVIRVAALIAIVVGVLVFHIGLLSSSLL